MAESKLWLREDLVRRLGEPANEWNSLSQVETTPKVTKLTHVDVAADTEGSTRWIQWRCTPMPPDAAEIHAAFQALQGQAESDEAEVKVLMTRAKKALDVIADTCIAMSDSGDGDAWQMFKVCSHHRPELGAGLCFDTDWKKQ